MSYYATVLPIMIASPSDVYEYRGLARDIIHEWSYVYSLGTNVVLMPVGWETHSSPELGSSAQDLINDRVLEDCDLLVGIFWTRLGTPTSKAASGTVEEIKRHIAAGKPAMVYFSTQPASLETVDTAQYAALKKFREWCEQKGLIETFGNASDFREKFRRHLAIELRDNPYLQSLVSLPNGGRVEAPSVSPNPEEELASSLSDEAKALLKEASKDRTGTIMNIATFGGRIIQANGKTLTSEGDRRSAARWEYAIEQLENSSLIVARGHKREVFEVTEQGYRVAELIGGHDTAGA